MGFRKTTLMLIAAAIILFIGCSNKEVTSHNYIFKGESDLWTAEYKVDGTDSWSKVEGKLHYESEATKVLTVTYKGDVSELHSVKHLEITYDTGTGGGKLTEDHDSDAPLSQKVFTFRSGGKGQLIPDKDEVIKVTINLDGDVQTIELKNVN
jgi:hypothetical protein